MIPIQNNDNRKRSKGISQNAGEYAQAHSQLHQSRQSDHDDTKRAVETEKSHIFIIRRLGYLYTGHAKANIRRRYIALALKSPLEVKVL